MVPLVLISAAAFAQSDEKTVASPAAAPSSSWSSTSNAGSGSGSGSASQQNDNRAVPRGSDGGSSSAGSRHTGGASSGSSSASSNQGGSSASSQGSSGRQGSASSDAASRRPRPGTGTGTRDRYGNDRDRYSSYPYSNYYYDPFVYSGRYPGRSYGRYGYGYGYYDYGYSYGDYYGYYPSSYARSYRYRSGNITQLRTMVEPAKARVYVDGYYAGIADDFDGLFQRLNISPGRHDITFKLEGYTSHTFSVYAGRDQTLKLRWDMVRGSGETKDSIGEEYDRRSDRDPGRESDRDANMDRDQDRDRDRASARDDADRSREVDSDRDAADSRSQPPARNQGRGELLLEVEPADASVYVDGEFYGKAAQVSKVELAAGRHRIEVVRPGYRTEETEVDVEGEAKKVVFKLSRR
jgi:hypothetical protein